MWSSATLRTNEVVVRVRAAGVNPGVINIRAGVLSDRLPANFPSGRARLGRLWTRVHRNLPVRLRLGSEWRVRILGLCTPGYRKDNDPHSRVTLPGVGDRVRGPEVGTAAHPFLVLARIRCSPLFEVPFGPLDDSCQTLRFGSQVVSQGNRHQSAPVDS